MADEKNGKTKSLGYKRDDKYKLPDEVWGELLGAAVKELSKGKPHKYKTEAKKYAQGSVDLLKAYIYGSGADNLADLEGNKEGFLTAAGKQGVYADKLESMIALISPVENKTDREKRFQMLSKCIAHEIILDINAVASDITARANKRDGTGLKYPMPQASARGKEYDAYEKLELEIAADPKAKVLISLLSGASKAITHSQNSMVATADSPLRKMLAREQLGVEDLQGQVYPKFLRTVFTYDTARPAHFYSWLTTAMNFAAKREIYWARQDYKIGKRFAPESQLGLTDNDGNSIGLVELGKGREDERAPSNLDPKGWVELVLRSDLLDEREKRILSLRFGFEDGENHSQKATGQKVGGISKERVKQIEKRIFAKIRGSFDDPLNPDRDTGGRC